MADSEALRLALVERAKREREARSKTTGDRLKEVGSAVVDNVFGFGEVDTPGERLGVTIRDSINAAESGARSTVAGLMDMPGMAWNALTGGAVRGVEATGLLPKGVTDTARETLVGQGPMGSGSTFRDAANAATGNSLDYQPQTEAGKYARTVGEFTPTAGAGFLKFGLAPGLLSEFAGQQTEGMTFPEGVPVVGGQNVEPYARAGAALAAPGAVSLGQKIVTPNPADPYRIAAAGRLKAEGIDTTAGQRTGNRALTFREGASRRTGDIVANQDEQFTTAALRRIDARDPQTLQPATRATPEVLKQAADDIGQKFGQVAESLSITPDQTLVGALRSAADDYAQLTTSAKPAGVITNTLSRIENALQQGKPISGSEYQNWRSQLSKASVGNDTQLANVAKDFIGALDEAVARSLPDSADVKLFEEARRQWRDFLAIQNAASKAGENTAVGILNPRQVRPAVTAGGGRSSYTTGGRDLGNLARDANAVVGPLNDPQQDLQIARLLGGAAGGGTAAGGLTFALTKDPVIAGAAGSLGILAPYMANRATGNPAVQRYLANQLLPNRSPSMSVGLMAGALQPLLQR